MALQMSRHLHQSFAEIMEWWAEDFFANHSTMIELLEAEAPKG